MELLLSVLAELARERISAAAVESESERLSAAVVEEQLDLAEDVVPAVEPSGVVADQVWEGYLL